MEGNEFIVAIVGIVFGTAFTAFVLYLIFSTIKDLINRKNSSVDDETFDRMAQSFIKHKEDTERRLENLEGLVTDEPELDSNRRKLEETEKTVEIDEEPPKKREHTENGNLKNILKE